MFAAKCTRSSLVLAALLALSACGDAVDRGPVHSETRAVGSFDSIDLKGSAQIEIQVGEAASLVVEGRQAALEALTTEVRGNTLHIERRQRHWFTHNGHSGVKLKIAVPQLQSLKLEGGNDVRLTGFKGGDSNIDVTGAAHITAAGRLDALTVHMAGAGHADMSKLIVDAATVTVDGVGSVTVSPKESLDATMNGVGAIFYTGSPRNVNSHMNGLGTISQRDEGSKKTGPGAQPDQDAKPPEKAADGSIVI